MGDGVGWIDAAHKDAFEVRSGCHSDTLFKMLSDN
jgi:hypothetical protein